jgi:hypothetical protein
MRTCDVVVAGAGPGGAIAGALLAAAGHDVVLVERERLPRFHIGESLLPATLPILARVGVDLEASGHLRKHGAEFFDEPRGDHSYFAFADARPGPPRFAYQVERARFDEQLVDAARRAGVAVTTATTIVGHQIDDDGIRLDLADTPPGPGPDEGHVTGADPRPAAGEATSSIRARYLVDASGRRSITARGGRDHLAIAGLGRAASFVHYDDIADEPWAQMSALGNVNVLRIDDGWMWAIPLASRRLSVGAVLRSGPVAQDIVLDHIAASPLLSRWTKGATRSPTRRIADYSFVRKTTSGPRWAAIGDAAGFLDPVFSSGVAIASAAAEALVQRLSPALRRGDEGSPAAVAGLREHMFVAYRTFHAIAHRFYNSRMFDNLFFGEVPDPAMRAGLISLLAGDMWSPDNPFAKAMLSAGHRALGHGESVLPWWVDAMPESA